MIEPSFHLNRAVGLKVIEQGVSAMESPLSLNEREALSRFLAKLIEDIERVATLFESRGADSRTTREAQERLKSTLESLASDEDLDPAEFQVCAPDGF